MGTMEALSTLPVQRLTFCLLADGSIDLLLEEPEGAYFCLKKLLFLRLRDASTGRERLEVALYDAYNEIAPYAVTYCTLLDLQRDLLRLKDFGFICKRKITMGMAQEIEKHYHRMIPHTDESARTLEADMGGIVRHICRYLLDENIEARTINGVDMFNIAVKDFKVLFTDSPYSHYRNTNIRRILRDLNYTLCSEDRLDNTIKVGSGGETIKVISILADEVESVMEELQELKDEAELEDYAIR
jgi:uncharacterized protein YlbG (UPF0298 family)